MWVSRQRWSELSSEAEKAGQRAEIWKREAHRERDLRLAAQKQTADLADRIVQLAQRPPVIVQPPDTAAIVTETINGMATVLNGWRTEPSTEPMPGVSMDQFGFDDRVGVPQNLDQFQPPWEEVGQPIPSHGGWVNGAYPPYVPGQGNTTPPKGGVE